MIDHHIQVGVGVKFSPATQEIRDQSPVGECETKLLQNYHKSPEISCTTVLLYFMAQRRGAWSHVPHLWANQNAGIRGQQVQRGIRPYAFSSAPMTVVL